MAAATERIRGELVLRGSAPAKLNLALAVRSLTDEAASLPAGLHEIASWMHLIELAGEVRVSHAPETTLNLVWADDAPRRSPIDWNPADDLVMRAHAALEAATGRSLPTRLEVLKRVPVGGGLGGGSSEAATALVLMNTLHDLGLDTHTLLRVARSVGSDVAFFVWCECSGACSALVQGAGDVIEPCGPASADVVLMLPAFGCPTGEVYRAFDANAQKHLFRAEAVRQLSQADVVESFAAGLLFNDLAEPATTVRSELASLANMLEQGVGQRVMVTGSGSTLFTLARAGDGPELAQRLALHLREQPEAAEPAFGVIANRFANR